MSTIAQYGIDATHSSQQGNGDTIEAILRSAEDEEKLAEIAKRMAREVVVKDRIYRMKEYKSCFKGTDAVRWMLDSGICQSVGEAVHIGNRLREMGFIRHVSNAHIFCDKDYYYWFNDNALSDRGDRCQTSVTSSWSMFGWRGVASSCDHDVGNELVQLQRKVHTYNADLRSRLQQTREDIAEVMQEVDTIEKKLQLELIDQKWWTALLLSGFGLVALLLQTSGFNWILKPFGIILLIHSILEMQRAIRTRELIFRKKHQLKQIRTFSNRSISSIEATSDETSSSQEDNNSVSVLTPRDFDTWPDAPCLWYMPPCLENTTPRRLRINSEVPVTFETELFKGEATLWVEGLASTPPGLFQGKKRKSSLIIRGRFKKAMSFNEVYTGQQFSRQLKDLPAEFLLNALLKIVKSLNPSTRHQLTPHPEFLSSIIATAQIVNVSKPGSESAIDDTSEDMRLVSDQFQDATGAPLCAIRRKRMMSQSCNRAPFHFDSDNIWTFHFWQHMLDLSTYQLDMTIKRFNLTHHLDGQPLLLMARNEVGQFLWNFELWHRDLLT